MNKETLNDRQDIFAQIQSLNKEDRAKMMYEMLVQLDPALRKKFISELLRYVVADEKLTAQVFKPNTLTTVSKKSKIINLTTEELAMIKQVTSYTKKLRNLVR